MAEGEKEQQLAKPTPPGKAELVSALATSRARLSSDLKGIGYEIDVKSRLQSSIRRNTGSWLTGAATTGLVLSLLPRRRKKVVIENTPGGTVRDGNPGKSKPRKERRAKSLLLESLKLALPIAKPLLLAVATRKVNNLANRIQND